MHELTPDQERALIPEIMAFFALPAPQAVTPVTEGISNHNYIVATARGEFFVKFVRQRDPRQIENNLAIQRQLTRGGVRTPVTLNTPQGDVIYRAGETPVVVSEKLAGVVPRRMNPGLAFSMGRTLARYHALVRKLPHPARCWIDPAAAAVVTDEVRALREADLPSGFTHGDFHLGNVHVLPEKPDEVYAIMDFEDGGAGAFMVDLARSILDSCITEDWRELDPDFVKAEVAGYESIRTLTEEERALLPAAVAYVNDACIRWFREFGFERYIPDHRTRAASFVSPF